MNTAEIIMGIIEAFTNAVAEKTNWSRNAVVALLRDILQSFPMENPAVFLDRFTQLLTDKTGWGSKQLIHQLQAAWIISLATALQSAEERICGAQSEITTLEAEVSKAQVEISKLLANPAAPAPFPFARTQKIREFSDLIVRLKGQGWKLINSKPMRCKYCEEDKKQGVFVDGDGQKSVFCANPDCPSNQR